MEILPLRTTERWFLAATIFVVVAYSWLLARALEPRVSVPSSVVSGVVWLSRGEPVDGDALAVRHSPAAVGLRRELEWMSEAIMLLGPFRVPPVLAIAIDEKDRALIGDERILLSADLATGDGRILKALLKAWLYQNAAVDVTSSLLRLETAAEFLSYVVRARRPAPAVGNWLSFASSFESSGAEGWGVPELQRFIGRSQKMNPLAFRPLLVGMLWEIYEQTPRLERFEFLRRWVRSLGRSSSFSPAKAPPETLYEWRAWLLDEFDALADGPRAALESVIARAGLGEAPIVHTWLARRDAKFALTNLAEASAQPAIVDSGDDELWLIARSATADAPVWVKLAARDRIELRVRQYVWEGCGPMQLGELLRRSRSAEHILFIYGCDRENGTEIGWRAFLAGGLREFARSRPEVQFTQLRRSAVELALRHGKLNPDDRVEKFLSGKLNPVFGIQSAQWSRDLHAYRVLGAIEAFEWIRSSPVATASNN